jgi:hypothetical protein
MDDGNACFTTLANNFVMGRPTVRAIEDDVVVGERRQFLERHLVPRAFDPHFAASKASEVRLWLSDVTVRIKYLPMQVRFVYTVEIANVEAADPSAGKVLNDRRPRATSTDNENR